MLLSKKQKNLALSTGEGQMDRTEANVEAKKIFDKWNSLSDNGPWTGEEDKCYSTVTITYEKNNVIQKREIKIIDDNSIVLVLNDGNRYYTNAKNVVDYLNELFNKY